MQYIYSRADHPGMGAMNRQCVDWFIRVDGHGFAFAHPTSV